MKPCVVWATESTEQTQNPRHDPHRQIHMNTKLPSIRLRLAHSLLIWAVIWGVAVSLAVWLAVQQEVDELLDDTPEVFVVRKAPPPVDALSEEEAAAEKAALEAIPAAVEQTINAPADGTK